MKNKIIKMIKKNPFLYNLAKKVYRIFNKEPLTVPYIDETIYVGYVLNDIKELEGINKHFEDLKINKSKILLIVSNDNIDVHDLMPDYVVVFLSYFRKYYKKFQPHNLIMADSIKIFDGIL